MAGRNYEKEACVELAKKDFNSGRYKEAANNYEAAATAASRSLDPKEAKEAKRFRKLADNLRTAANKQGISKSTFEKHIVTILLIICVFILAVLFLSFGFTGNTISNLEQGTNNVIGLILFFAGLSGFYVLKREIKRKKNS